MSSFEEREWPNEMCTDEMHSLNVLATVGGRLSVARTGMSTKPVSSTLLVLFRQNEAGRRCDVVLAPLAKRGLSKGLREARGFN